MPIVSKDVIILPESTPDHPNRWVMMNVFARTSLGVGGEVLAVLGQSGDQPVPPQQSFRCWEVDRFSNEDGLLADPSRYERDPGRWRPLDLSFESLLGKLAEKWIIVQDEDAYRARFGDKRNILDRQHFGNFHQQHGQHLLLNRRVDPANWWMDQKFTKDRREVRADTLYGAVQASFLENYFAERIRPDMSVIDLGCGTGVYANMIARHGASVLGIDPSAEYLRVAQKNALPGMRFQELHPGIAGSLDVVPDGLADLIFMSDALLFYFRQFYPGQQADITVLLSDIRRILKPSGSFVSLEPHGVFFLTPWLGSVDRPFTVITEYLHKSYGIAPPISWLTQHVMAAGFCVSNFREIQPSEYYKEIDARGFSFASEFPVWHLLEFSKTAGDSI